MLLNSFVEGTVLIREEKLSKILKIWELYLSLPPQPSIYAILSHEKIRIKKMNKSKKEQ